MSGLCSTMRMCWVTSLWLSCAAIGLVGEARAQENEMVVTPLVGASVRAKKVSVTAGKMTGEGLPVGMKLADVRRLEPVKSKPRESGAVVSPGMGAVVHLVGGSVLVAKGTAIRNEEAELTGTGAGDLKFPVEKIRSLRWGSEVAAVEESEKTPLAEQDKFLLRVEGKIATTAGLLVEVNEEQVVFTFEGEDRRVPRKDLVAIVVAQASGEEKTAACEVMMESGERLCGSLEEMSEQRISIDVLESQQVAVEMAKVVAVKMHSDRVVMLSNQKPREVIQKNIVAPARAWQVNRSVQGNPLTLGNEVFVEGMGVSAYTALTFEVEGKYERFAAVIGIDKETQGHGNCVFRVMGDGRELFQKKKTGSESGEPIDVVIRGVKVLTLVVEPGEELDLADHANWCEARVLKSGL